MDKLTKYRQITQDILLEYSQYQPASHEMEIETIFDTKRDHYQVVSFGWEGTKYVHYCLIHIDLTLPSLSQIHSLSEFGRGRRFLFHRLLTRLGNKSSPRPRQTVSTSIFDYDYILIILINMIRLEI